MNTFVRLRTPLNNKLDVQPKINISLDPKEKMFITLNKRTLEPSYY